MIGLCYIVGYIMYIKKHRGYVEEENYKVCSQIRLRMKRPLIYHHKIVNIKIRFVLHGSTPMTSFLKALILRGPCRVATGVHTTLTTNLSCLKYLISMDAFFFIIKFVTNGITI